ncbi:hypothetical protein [Pontibacter sp. G13]|uniref:tetratricopeptide repeat protein n=1 Tax=Pontibacter sp. G13 TaxID=3074898 RepID=UPI00288C0DCC|nr:hypothetical protein [Pontibacter sp. G13]WNJ16250.1 hypothetical protein RJD25_15410 [Pontibacter sp. G13]
MPIRSIALFLIMSLTSLVGWARPHHPQWCTARGMILNGHIGVAEALLTAQPLRGPIPHYLLGLIDLEVGKFTEARLHFEHGLLQSKTNALCKAGLSHLAMLEGDVKTSMKLRVQAYRKVLNSQWHVAVELAWLKTRWPGELHREGMQELAALRQIHPQMALIPLMMSQNYLSTRQPQNGLLFALEAVSLAPDQFPILLHAARTSAESQQPIQARQLLKHALQQPLATSQPLPFWIAWVGLEPSSVPTEIQPTHSIAIDLFDN